MPNYEYKPRAAQSHVKVLLYENTVQFSPFQFSYLRLDVDLLCSVFGEPAHVDLTVKVADVTDDGVVLHFFKVTDSKTQNY